MRTASKCRHSPNFPAAERPPVIDLSAVGREIVQIFVARRQGYYPGGALSAAESAFSPQWNNGTLRRSGTQWFNEIYFAGSLYFR